MTSLDGSASRVIDVTVNGADEPTGIIFGTPGDDVFLDGTGANDVINALTGNDIVRAGNGDDRIVAGIGDGYDIYYGGAGSDTYDLSATTAAATVNFFGSPIAIGGTSFSSQTGLDTLQEIENVIGSSGGDRITGNGAANLFDGFSGNDTIDGFGGNDTIIGGAGNDSLRGGTGDDVFVFRSGFGKDLVGDFALGTPANHDTLDLRGLGFASVAAVLAATDLGPNAVIHVGVDDITLSGVTKAQLAAASYAILI